jgi:dUTPase
MPSTGLLLTPQQPPPPAPVPRVQNPYNQPRAPPQPPAPIGARRVFDTIDQEDQIFYSQTGSLHPLDDASTPPCPPVPPPGFEEDNNSVADNFINIPSDPYFQSSTLPSILNPPHLSPKKRVRFAIPSSTPSCLVSCRYIPSNPSPFSSLTSSTSSFIRAVCDSGASHTMTSHRHLFTDITLFNANAPRPSAIMGDDSTQLPIAGYGYISFKVHGYRLRLFSYFVPGLGATLLSIKQHMRTQGCYFHAEAKDTILAYPTFQLFPRVSAEIDMLLSPSPTSSQSYDFDETLTTPIDIHQPLSSKPSSSSPSIDLTLMSPTLPRYISQPSLQQPFTHSIQFHRVLPSAPFPQQVPRSKGHFTASTVTPCTLQPGSSASVPTGLRTILPANVTLHSCPLPSFHLPGLQIIDKPINTTNSPQLFIRITNTSTTPITIPSHQPIASFHFIHNQQHLIPFVPPSSPPSRRTPEVPPQLSPSNHSFSTAPGRLTTFNGTSSTTYTARRASRPPPTRQLLHTNSSRLPDPETLLNSNIFPATSPDLIQHTPIDPKKHISPGPSLTSPRSPSPSDSVNAALPKVVTMTRQCLLQSIGFRKPDSILKHMKNLSSTPISIQRDSSPRLDPGEVATMQSSRRNTTPSQVPPCYSDVWHLDIGYGPTKAIGGIRYTLLAVDKRTRYTLVYGLKNLTTSLLSAVKQFITDCGVPPKLLRTDFDHKIMGGAVKSFLHSSHIPIESSPPYRQHQNGLVESHWKHIVNMSRNWLTSSLLPSTYWFFAVKRASEVCNIMPTSHLGSVTTPFELVHKRKVDYRLLFPMFSSAFIKYRRADGSVKNKWVSQTLKCIVVGTCRTSNGLLFYHPQSKQLITCGDGYKFDTFSPSGPQFNEKFDGSFAMSTYHANQVVHQPHSFEISNKIFFKNPDSPSSYLSASILAQPHDEDSDPYTVQVTSTGAIIQLLASDLLDHDPTVPPISSTPSVQFPHLPWIKHNAISTLYLPDKMTTPKQGFLKFKDNNWFFHLGRDVNKTKHPLIPLASFVEIAESLVHNKKLFQGRKTNAFVLNARQCRAVSNVISHLVYNRKVTAANLHTLQAPTLLNHSKLHPDDKTTWDAAYLSEYNGLVDIDTWETITEAQYQSMKHLYHGIMPTMAISTIKYDGDGKPNRAKYRIVALGNLDPHTWTKSDCFAPVLSQLELRFLTALAVRKRCIPKTGDVTQAFCQSSLPPDEHYICRPPPGCPITPPNSYWRLKKTLYGLKRSPRHFYMLARKLLLQLGLKQHPTSPCIFYGSIISGEPPLYLGLYVDDFIYFSESSRVESLFEKKFGAAITTDFNGQIGYFLGINFTCTKHDDGAVTIHLGQEAFIENLCQLANLDNPHVAPVHTPYRSGCTVDNIPTHKSSSNQPSPLTHKMQVLVGCLTWLSISTRPDIATITNLLAQYTTKATNSHLNQVKRVIKYLRSTKTLGISFHSDQNSILESYVKFPVPDGITSMCDANWGPQDQSRPVPNETRTLDLFKSRSLSGFLIYFGGPMHWISKRQTITARSSAEAEIYATDECTKCLIHLHQIVDGLELTNDIMSLPTTIYNDNAACVNWSRNMTTKGLRHIQMRENAVRESYQSGFLVVKHVPGKRNLSDMFTKEDKDTSHFLEIRDVVMSDRNNPLALVPQGPPFSSLSHGGC